MGPTTAAPTASDTPRGLIVLNSCSSYVNWLSQIRAESRPDGPVFWHANGRTVEMTDGRPRPSSDGLAAVSAPTARAGPEPAPPPHRRAAARSPTETVFTVPLAGLVEDVDRFQPPRLRRVIHLAEIRQRRLPRPIGRAHPFDERPVGVSRAIFLAVIGSQKHRRGSSHP
jgi:hypothetical protein